MPRCARGLVGLLVAVVFVWMWSGALLASEPVERAPVIFIDPGHGGVDSGAAFRGDGLTVVEAVVNLDVALRTADILRARGYEVYLSRETAEQPGGSEDVNGDGASTSRDGLQAVVDGANAVGADLFLSIHHNGSADPKAAGTEVYYCADRPFAEESFRFGTLVLNYVRGALRSEGYNSPNRGLKDDAVLYARGGVSRGHLFVLGPVRSFSQSSLLPRPAATPAATPSRRYVPKLRATEMPGVLSEALFVSNPHEAWLLSQPRIRDAMARGFADAVSAYFTPAE